MEDLFETVGKVNITNIAAVEADRERGIEAVEAVQWWQTHPRRCGGAAS